MTVEYLCLVTTPGYAPGAVCLAQSLSLVGSHAVLRAIATSAEAEAALRCEAATCRRPPPLVIELRAAALPPPRPCHGGRTHAGKGAVLSVDAPRRLLWQRRASGEKSGAQSPPLPQPMEQLVREAAAANAATAAEGFVLLDCDLIAVQPPEAFLSLHHEDCRGGHCGDCSGDCSGMGAVPAFRLKKRAFGVPGAAGTNFNSGVLAVPAPCPKDAQHLDAMVAAAGEEDTEELLMNKLFKGRWRALPRGLNVPKRVLQHAPGLWDELVDNRELVFLHFMGAKPWMRDPAARAAADWEAERPAYRALESLWWRIRNEELLPPPHPPLAPLAPPVGEGTAGGGGGGGSGGGGGGGGGGPGEVDLLSFLPRALPHPLTSSPPRGPPPLPGSKAAKRRERRQQKKAARPEPRAEPQAGGCRRMLRALATAFPPVAPDLPLLFPAGPHASAAAAVEWHELTPCGESWVVLVRRFLFERHNGAAAAETETETVTLTETAETADSASTAPPPRLDPTAQGGRVAGATGRAVGSDKEPAAAANPPLLLAAPPRAPPHPPPAGAPLPLRALGGVVETSFEALWALRPAGERRAFFVRSRNGSGSGSGNIGGGGGGGNSSAAAAAAAEKGGSGKGDPASPSVTGGETKLVLSHEKRWSQAYGASYTYGNHPRSPTADGGGSSGDDDGGGGGGGDAALGLVRHRALPAAAHPLVPGLCRVAEALAPHAAPYAMALVNWYGPQDSVAAHSDDEPALKPGAEIFSFSLGAARRFVLKPRALRPHGRPAPAPLLPPAPPAPPPPGQGTQSASASASASASGGGGGNERSRGDETGNEKKKNGGEAGGGGGSTLDYAPPSASPPKARPEKSMPRGHATNNGAAVEYVRPGSFRLELVLGGGDLLVMGGTCQATHKHQVPPPRRRPLGTPGACAPKTQGSNEAGKGAQPQQQQQKEGGEAGTSDEERSRPTAIGGDANNHGNRINITIRACR